MEDKISWKELFSEANGSAQKKEEFIKASQAALAKLIEKGYRLTPDGYLSPVDIKRGGYIWRKDAEVYMIPGSGSLAQQYLSFRKELLARSGGSAVADVQIEKLAQSNFTGFSPPPRLIIK